MYQDKKIYDKIKMVKVRVAGDTKFFNSRKNFPREGLTNDVDSHHLGKHFREIPTEVPRKAIVPRKSGTTRKLNASLSFLLNEERIPTSRKCDPVSGYTELKISKLFYETLNCATEMAN